MEDESKKKPDESDEVFADGDVSDEARGRIRDLWMRWFMGRNFCKLRLWTDRIGVRSCGGKSSFLPMHKAFMLGLLRTGILSQRWHPKTIRFADLRNPQ
jgi:hypothetical protein